MIRGRAGLSCTPFFLACRRRLVPKEIMALRGLTRRGVCLATGALSLAVAAPAMGQTRHIYGQHSRNTLLFLNGRGTGPNPVVIMVPDKPQSRSELIPHARELVRRSISVAVIDRREGRHGFMAHTSDVARAAAYLQSHASELKLEGRIAFWGQGEGADMALLCAADRRYLSSVGVSPRDIVGMALLGGNAPDPTFTHPSAYRGESVPAVFRGGRGDTASATAFLSGLL